MQTSTRLNLKLPGDADNATPEDFNANFRIIESYVTSLTQVCSAHTPAETALASTHKTVQFGGITKSGYVFALSGGGVKLSEAGFAMVDMHVLVHSMAPGDVCTADICKNGATMYQCVLDVAEYGAGVTIDQSSRLLPVAKNDIFTIKVRNDTFARGYVNQNASYMNVRFFKSLNF